MKTMFKAVVAVFTAMILMGTSPAYAERHDASDMSEMQLKSIAAQDIGGWWLIGPLFVGGVDMNPRDVMRKILEVEWVDDDGTFKVVCGSGDGDNMIMEGWRDWEDTLGYGEGRRCMYMTLPNGNVHTLIKVE